MAICIYAHALKTLDTKTYQASPSLQVAKDLYDAHFKTGHNTLPISLSLPAPDTLTPVIAYLRLTEGASSSKSSFLLESVLPGSTQGRYSFVGCGMSRPLLPSLDSRA